MDRMMSKTTIETSSASKPASGMRRRCHDPARVCIVKLERLRVDVHWRDDAVLAGGARCRLLQHIVTDVDCNELEPARNVRDVLPGLHTNHETAPCRPANEGGLEPATAEIGPLEHLCK